MKGKSNKLVAVFTSYVCKKSALSTSVSACSWGMFQPKEPKCLKK
ncbi:cyclic lactone autoinducer peptide [Clostridium thailandense]